MNIKKSGAAINRPIAQAVSVCGIRPNQAKLAINSASVASCSST